MGGCLYAHPRVFNPFRHMLTARSEATTIIGFEYGAVVYITSVNIIESRPDRAALRDRNRGHESRNQNPGRHSLRTGKRTAEKDGVIVC
jgi:orotate phosphoribosyltransferase